MKQVKFTAMEHGTKENFVLLVRSRDFGLTSCTKLLFEVNELRLVQDVNMRM